MNRMGHKLSVASQVGFAELEACVMIWKMLRCHSAACRMSHVEDIGDDAYGLIGELVEQPQ